MQRKALLRCHGSGAGCQPGLLWGDLSDMQHFADKPAEQLMRHMEGMLQTRPDELRMLLWDRMSPGFAELLTCKLEERAAQAGGGSSICLGVSHGTYMQSITRCLKTRKNELHTLLWCMRLAFAELLTSTLVQHAAE